MSCVQHKCEWMACTLCRSGRQILSTYEKALKRNANWPCTNQCAPTLRTPVECTSINEAFETMLQSMVSTTHQCERLYRSQVKQNKDKDNDAHYNRFHHPSPSGHHSRRYQNPLEQAEGVNVEVSPGTYTVSAGTWGSDSQHTHVVHIQEGQMVNLNFNM